MCAPVPLLKTLSADSSGTAHPRSAPRPWPRRRRPSTERCKAWRVGRCRGRGRASPLGGGAARARAAPPVVCRGHRTRVTGAHTYIIRYVDTPARTDPRPGPVMSHEMYIQRATSHTPARHNHESPAAARGPTAIDDGTEDATRLPDLSAAEHASEATRKWYNLLLEVQSFGNVDASSPTQKLPPFNLYYSTIVYLLELDVAGRQTARPHATRARTFAAGRRRLTPRDSLSPSRL